MTRLADTGSVYVTLSAARTFAAHVGAQPEEARRELTEILLDATERKGGSWRTRKRSIGIDVTARVRHESGLAVVTTISSRDYNPRRGGAAR